MRQLSEHDANAQLSQAEAYAHSARFEEALRTLDELAFALERDTGRDLNLARASLFRLRGDILTQLNDSEGALEAWNSLLQMGDDLPEAARGTVAVAVQPRHAKAVILATRGQFDAASTLLEEALDALTHTTSSQQLKAKAALGVVLTAVEVSKTETRLEESQRLSNRLAGILGDCDEPSESYEEAPEIALASRLAQELDRDRKGDLVSSYQGEAQHAASLYQASWPWMVDSPSGAEAASFLLQALGDEYALQALAVTGGQGWREVPSRIGHILSQLQDGTDLNAWVGGLDQQLPKPAELAGWVIRASVPDQPSPDGSSEDALRSIVVDLMSFYEPLYVALGSPSGREAARSARISQYGMSVRAVLGVLGEGASGGLTDCSLAVAGWSMLLARGLFAISHAGTSLDRSYLPSPPVLRSQLLKVDGFDWLNEHQVTVPSWLS